MRRRPTPFLSAPAPSRRPGRNEGGARDERRCEAHEGRGDKKAVRYPCSAIVGPVAAGGPPGETHRRRREASAIGRLGAPEHPRRCVRGARHHGHKNQKRHIMHRT